MNKMANTSITFDRAALRDKIYACWVGKNIGGTMGAPYEGTRQLLDIQGFATEAGKVLPNDDLDLQLVWLRAVDEMGIEAVNERVLGEYWLSYIGPAWNEYGVGKSNMREGLLPPLSGEAYNDRWRHSNGAWIRTEIWASLFPGCPEKAIRYAFYDACNDHGYSEGTYAAIFVAAVESAAFVYNDIDLLLRIGLSKIPATCRMAAAVRLVMDEYAKGTDWKTVRQLLVEQSADIGWFQAPANVAYVVLGLLYGGCDFKKSMILALNCGDDTDCTGATLGALLGIMYGTAGLPADWRTHIGDAIVTCCNLNGHGAWPASCTDLTDRVMDLLPATLRRRHYHDGTIGTARKAFAPDRIWAQLGEKDDFAGLEPEAYLGDSFVQDLSSRSRYSFSECGIYCDVLVELDSLPEIAPSGTVTGRITVQNHRVQPASHYRLRWFVPQGWSAEGRRNLAIETSYNSLQGFETVSFAITAGETVEATNRLVLEVSCVGRPTCVYVPVVLLG